MLAVEGLLGGLFLVYAWGMTASYAHYGPVDPFDLVVIALPLATVVCLGAASTAMWGANLRRTAIPFALLPIVVVIGLYKVFGVV